MFSSSANVENCKVFVKRFSGAKVRCMEEYIQATLRETPTHVIPHVGTNDVTAKQDPIAVKIKRNCDVSISSINARNDKYLWEGAGVNRNLKDSCLENNLHFTNHGKAINVKHLNASKLHLSKVCSPRSCSHH